MMKRSIALVMMMFTVLVIILFSVLVLTADREKQEQLPANELIPADDLIIKDVSVEERPLSEIITDEDDRFAANAEADYLRQPFFDESSGMYYYRIFGADSARDDLYCDNGVDEPSYTGVPDVDYYEVGVIREGTIYGVELYYGDDGWYYFLTAYNDGHGERILETPIEGCYFAQEGIYYQSGQSICLTDYTGSNISTVLEIPDELYVEGARSELIVYRGVLWYSYYDVRFNREEYDYPLWCYDFENTIIRFNKGRVEKANNGFLYFIEEDEQYNTTLCRLDCDEYFVEVISDYPEIGDYDLYNDSVYYAAYDEADNADYLWRLNADGCEKILSPDQLGESEYILLVCAVDERLFVTGGEGMFYSCLAEIDADGNVISVIHED